MPFCKIALRAQRPPSPAYPLALRTLGDHLRKKRLDLRLLQREVAARLGVDETTICNWESHRTAPQPRLTPGIIAFLGYNPYDTQSATFGERLIAHRYALGA